MLSGPPAREAAQKSSTFLEEQASRLGVFLAASHPWTVDDNYDRPCNTLRVFGPSGHLGDYSKRHLFGLDSREAALYRPGDTFLTLKIEDLRVSFFICYDLRFPLAFRHLAEDTDLFVLVANWPDSRAAQWRTLLTARAIDNQAYVTGCNIVGQGDGILYSGGSLIINPLGEIMADAEDREAVVSAKIEPEKVHAWRAGFSILADGKKDFSLFSSFRNKLQPED